MSNGYDCSWLQLNKYKRTGTVLYMLTQVESLATSIISIKHGQIRLQPNTIITESQIDISGALCEIGFITTKIALYICWSELLY